MLDRAMELRPWHVIVVGGGCTGIATALDAAARGYRTLLVERGSGDNTAALSRDHSVSVSRRGLVTVTGGKWTTCRKVAQDTVDKAADVGGLSPAPSVTANLRLYGYSTRRDLLDPWRVYGAQAEAVRELAEGYVQG